MKVEPQRSCIGCGEKKDKKDLLRIVRSPEGEYAVDLQGRKNGRGAYLCKNLSCLEKAEKKKAFFRSFKEAIPKEDLDRLGEEIKEMAKEDIGTLGFVH